MATPPPLPPADPRCPDCGSAGWRVIYLGFPMKLCEDDACCTVWGFWSWLPFWFPVVSDTGFKFTAYEPGHYWSSLRAWLR